MTTRTLEFAAGLFLLAGLAAITYLAVHVGGGRFFQGETYALKARFASVAGLKPGSAVHIAGVRVGEVVRLDLNPADFSAIVTFSVSRDIELEDDTMASIKSSGLIGDKYLALLPGGSGVPLVPGDLIVDTESAIDFEGLIRRFAFGGVGGDAPAENP